MLKHGRDMVKALDVSRSSTAGRGGVRGRSPPPTMRACACDFQLYAIVSSTVVCGWHDFLCAGAQSAILWHFGGGHLYEGCWAFDGLEMKVFESIFVPMPHGSPSGLWAVEPYQLKIKHLAYNAPSNTVEVAWDILGDISHRISVFLCPEAVWAANNSTGGSSSGPIGISLGTHTSSPATVSLPASIMKGRHILYLYAAESSTYSSDGYAVNLMDAINVEGSLSAANSGHDRTDSAQHLRGRSLMAPPPLAA